MTGKEIVDSIYALRSELKEVNAQLACIKEIQHNDEDSIISPTAIAVIQERKAAIVTQLDTLQDSEWSITNPQPTKHKEDK